MRIVVTGAAGFIGFHLAKRLLDLGHEVIAVDNLLTGLNQNAEDLAGHDRCEFLRHDIVEPLDLAGPIDVVYNLACPASPVDFGAKAIDILRVCSEGLYQVLELAARTGAIFLQASTSECYGDPIEHPQKETDFGHVNPIGPRSCYDEGKRFGEAMCVAYHRTRGTKVRIVRIFNTYGPRMRTDDGRIIPNFFKQAMRNEPLTVYGTGEQTRSFCYVDDLVAGIIRRTEVDFVEPINLGNDEEITVLQLAREVIELTHSESELLFRPLPDDDPVRRRPDLARAREVLGWQPTTPRRQGLAASADYFRSVLARVVHTK